VHAQMHVVLQSCGSLLGAMLGQNRRARLPRRTQTRSVLEIRMEVHIDMMSTAPLAPRAQYGYPNTLPPVSVSQ